MDLDDFTEVLRQTGADLWGLIDAAISVAARDHGRELRVRRDGIVERLYLASTTAAPRQEEGGRSIARERETVRANGRVVEEEGGGAPEWKGRASPSTPQSIQRDEEDEEDDGEHGHGLEHDLEDDEEDEKTKILAIKEHIEDPDQDDETLINLLQNLLDMEISFRSLRDTDIGRHVNNLRKHPSPEVRRLVKLLVRNWKDVVADWVKINSNETGSSAIAAAIITDGDSPQQIPPKTSNFNSYHPLEHGYSPNHHYGNPSSEKHNREPEPLKAEPSRQKAVSAPRRESAAPARPAIPAPSSVQSKSKEQIKDSLLDPERLASARKRLQDNYQEIQNAKKQRTIQVMDINDIPKKKNTFIPKSKQGKHW